MVIITDTIVWSFIKARLTIILLTVHMYLPAIPILMQIDNNTCDSVTRDNTKSRLDGHGRTKDRHGQMLDKSFVKICPPDGHGRTKLCKFEVGLDMDKSKILSGGIGHQISVRVDF